MTKVRVSPNHICYILSSLLAFCSMVSKNTGKLESLELSDFFDIFRLFPFKIACWMFGSYLCANKKKNVSSAAVQKTCPN